MQPVRHEYAPTIPVECVAISILKINRIKLTIPIANNNDNHPNEIISSRSNLFFIICTPPNFIFIL